MSHRFRLSIGVAASTGVLLLALFTLGVHLYRQEGANSEQNVLGPALMSAAEECFKRPNHPELFEVTSVTPQLTLAVFLPDGRLVSQSGAMPLVSMRGKGIATFGANQAAYAGIPIGDRTLMAAVPLVRWDEEIGRLVKWLAFLWVLLVGLAFGLTLLASRATFKPVVRLASQAEALSALDLSQRLDEEDLAEYASIASSLNRFLDRLETSLKREEQFAADAAHELRTPLTIIRSKVEATLSERRNPKEDAAVLRSVLHEAERLSGIVEGLLLSATNAQPIAFEVQVSERAEIAHARWVDRFHEKGVELHLEAEPACANILPEELDMVLDNLLSNAFKASPKGSRCRIAARVEAGAAVVEVVDEGPGIDDAMREKVFERFTTGDPSRNREGGGYGVGLSICRRIVEARGGRVYVAKSDRGARFVVEFHTAA